MDPYTGKVYSSEEISSLPPEVKERLVPVGPARNVRRRQGRRPKNYTNLKNPEKDVSSRRAANKRAKKARKKNRT